MKKYLYIVWGCLLMVLSGCENDSMAPFASKYPSVDERFKSSMTYHYDMGYDTLIAKSEEYKIYVCTDTHLAVSYQNLRDAELRGDDPLKLLSNLATFIQLYRADTLCPAAVHLGDLVESDITYDVFRYPLKKIPLNPNKYDTMYTTIGNHDIFYTQYYAYRYHVAKSSTYYFIVKTPSGKKDLFICLDTATGTLGRMQLQWLKDLLAQANDKSIYHTQYRHIIVYTHVNIFRRDNTSADISTTAIEETNELMYLFRKYNVKQFWAGHDHSREEFMQGGVKYIIVDSMEETNKEAAFMILHVGEELNNTFHSILPYRQQFYP